jgi:hypothetical protein
VGCNQQACRNGLDGHYGAHIMPTCAQDAGYGAIGLNVFPTVFQFCFGLVPPFYVLTPPFWNRNVYFTSLHIGGTKFSFLFYRAHS